jgi:hypothetical protein
VAILEGPLIQFSDHLSDTSRGSIMEREINVAATLPRDYSR